MFNHTASNSQLIVGSRTNWLAMRVGEGLTIFLLLIFVPFLASSDWRFGWVFGTLMLYTFAKAHQVVYGFADADGIHFRHYFKWRIVAWGEVQSISRTSPIMITVDLEKRMALTRRLIFMKDVDIFRPLEDAGAFARLRQMWVERRGK